MKDTEDLYEQGTNEEKYILVFKTNISSEKDLEKTMNILNTLPGILRWSINREDKDKVLRIESNTNITTDIINTITQSGYTCEELPDQDNLKK